MQYKMLHETAGQRTFAVVLDAGDEVLASLEDFIKRENIHAAYFTAIGAFSDVVLLYFDWQKKDYRPLPYTDPVYLEMLTLTSGYGDQSGFKKIVASGGRISASDCAWPWAGTGSVLTAPALPTFEPQ